MEGAELFLLLHESGSVTKYMKRTEECISESSEVEYLNRLNFFLEYYSIENHQGFYDAENIQSHLHQFEELDDYYPCNPTMILRGLLSEWENWRDTPISAGDYILFENEIISNHIFCEVAQRKYVNFNNSYLLINHNATSAPENIPVKVLNTSVNIELLPLHKTFNWFCKNRKPYRMYHPSPKHGENGRGNWRNASLLLCYHQEAEVLLKTAVGKDDKALYNYDSVHQSYILFRKEGAIPEQKYHAYHIKETEVGEDIKALIEKLVG